MRQAINEAVSMASLAVSAVLGVIGVWGCPNATWFHWTTVGFFLLAGAFGIGALWQARWSKSKGPKEIANQEYLNCDVQMDGHLYLACRFTNVTFVCNGGDAGGFDGHCLFGGSIGLKTGDPKLRQMLGFPREIRMLRPDSFARYTPKGK
jgi:hypothetical protein